MVEFDVVIGASSEPYGTADGWNLGHFGVDEDSCSLQDGKDPRPLSKLAENVISALEDLPCSVKTDTSLDSITYITRGTLASIFLVGDYNEVARDPLNATGVIASISRNPAFNEILKDEFDILCKVSRLIRSDSFFESFPTSKFALAEPLALVEGDKENCTVYFTRLIQAYTAYPEREPHNYGHIRFELKDPSRSQDLINYGDNYLSSKEGQRHKGKQVLEDLAAYVLGVSFLSKNVLTPNLNYGDLMITTNTRPTIYLSNIRSLPVGKSEDPLVRQFMTLFFLPYTQGGNAKQPLFSTRLLMRGVEKFLNSSLIKDKEKKQSFLNAIKTHLSSSLNEDNTYPNEEHFNGAKEVVLNKIDKLLLQFK